MVANRGEKIMLYGFLLPAFLLLVGFYIFPAIWAVHTSFTNLALTGANALNPKYIGLRNFQKLFGDPAFFDALGRTALYAAGTIVGQFVIGMICALLMNRRRLLGQGILLAAVILPMVIPSLIQALLWQSMLANGDFGTLNRLISIVGIAPVQWVREFPMFSVILVNFWNNSGFAMILFLAGLENIPRELLESAEIDGATGFQQLLYIKIPLIRYVILLWLLLNTLGCFNTFELIYALTGGGPGTATTTMGIYIYNAGFRYFELGLGSAAGLVLLVVSLVMALIYVRLMRVEV
jgi:multiple sugar transport system permease protein